MADKMVISTNKILKIFSIKTPRCFQIILISVTSCIFILNFKDSFWINMNSVKFIYPPLLNENYTFARLDMPKILNKCKNKNPLQVNKLKYENKKNLTNVCDSENWITAEANGRLGNRMCEYAHLKVLELKYKIKVRLF